MCVWVGWVGVEVGVLMVRFSDAHVGDDVRGFWAGKLMSSDCHLAWWVYDDMCQPN